MRRFPFTRAQLHQMDMFTNEFAHFFSMQDDMSAEQAENRRKSFSNCLQAMVGRMLQNQELSLQNVPKTCKFCKQKS